MTPPLCAPDSVRGITVRQPWAACILYGGKRIENRPRAWAPGLYLLHAGAEVDRAALRSPLVARAVRGLELPTRAVLGLVRVTGTHIHADTDVEPCSPWAQPQRFHMDLDPVHPLAESVPCPGRLGSWRIPLGRS
jgi:hypothetical protein